jgi:4-amino-4-deoxy-L-arabinose transferase-like glycosyltransferase
MPYSREATNGLHASSGLFRLRLLVFAGAFAIGILTVFVLWDKQGLVEQSNDLYKFAELGRNIALGNGLRYDGAPLTIRRPPLYPALIALLYTIFGVMPHVIQVFQAVLAAGTALLAFEIGRRVFNLRTGIVAAIATALHPMVLRYIPDIQLETFLTFLYTLAVYWSVRLAEKGTLWNGFWFGLSCAAAAMVKGVALSYPALFILAYLWSRHSRDAERLDPLPGWRPVAALLLAMGLFILPWTYRNYSVTGRFVLISGNASGELLRGYVFAQPRYYLLRDRAYTDGEHEANEMQIQLFRSKGLVWERDEAETEQVQNLAARQKIMSSPGAYLKKCFIGAFMFWYVVTTKVNSLLVGSLALAGWILAFVGMYRARGKGYQFWLLLLPIASMNLIYAAILALGRYSAPCIPSLMVLASFGVSSLLPERRLASEPVRNSSP